VTAEVAAAASDTNGAPTGRHRARKPGGPAGSGGSGAPGGGTERSLSSRVAAATRWSLLNTVVIRVGNFALGVVLARYFLGPGEWGLYAVGLLVLNVLLSANEVPQTTTFYESHSYAWSSKVHDFQVNPLYQTRYDDVWIGQ